MNLQQKIFIRVTLLLFLLIIAIAFTAWRIELRHRRNDLLQTMEKRVEVLANSAGSFALQEKETYLQGVVANLSEIYPEVTSGFVEKDGQAIIDSGSGDDFNQFSVLETTNFSGQETRHFIDSNGERYIDIVAVIKGWHSDGAPAYLHVVLQQDSLIQGSETIVQFIVGVGILSFLLNLPAAWAIARLTTVEVADLNKKLLKNGEELERLVAKRTKSLRKYESIVASANDMMSFLDTDYIFRAINPAYEVFYNKPRQEIVGKSVADLYGEDIFNSFLKEKLDQCIAGETVEFRHLVDFENTGRRYLDIAYAPFFSDQNVVTGVVASVRDVTSLNMAQEAVIETEARYRSLFEGITNGVAIYSPVENGSGFVFLDYNPAGQEMDNKTKEEIIGKKLTDVFPSAKEFGLLEVLRRVYNTGITEELPATIYKDDKVVFWRQNTVYKLPSGELVAVYSDETSRKEAEKFLRMEHARFEAVLESLDAAVYAADMKTHELLFVNKRLRDSFDAFVGKPCWKSIQSAQTGPCDFCTNDRLLDSAGNPQKPYIWEFQNTTDGHWYQCHDQAIRWPDGRMVRLEIATDISDRKMREEEIQLRGRYLKGLSAAAHVLLVATSEAPLQDFIDAIGPCSNASRANVYMNHLAPGGSLLMSQIVEWCAEGIKPEIDNPLLQSVPADEWMSHWEGILLKGETINKCLSDFPEKERMILESLGTKAILLIPIKVENDLVGFVGLDNCISEKYWNESEIAFLQAATSDLSQTIRRLRSDKKVLTALNEKDALLREIHHRVKNNMQVITSLLNLQSRRISDEQALNAMQESQDRIHVMSLVHENLYHSGDLSNITMDNYFTNLLNDIAQIHNGVHENVSWQVDAGSESLSINEAIPIGLITNELISNAFKHAFPSGRKGRIELLLQKVGKGEMELIISDDGQGMPDGFDINRAETLGLQLVTRLAVGQLGGEFNISSEKGTKARVTFFNGFQMQK